MYGEENVILNKSFQDFGLYIFLKSTLNALHVSR